MCADSPLKRRLPAAHYQALTTRNQIQSPLLHLPGELRNLIYNFTLDMHSSKLLHNDLHDWDRLELSRTCRQVYKETYTINQNYIKTKLSPLSAERGVLCPADKRLEVFLSELTSAQKLQIKTLTLDYKHVREIVETLDFSLLWTLPNLRLLKTTSMTLPAYDPMNSWCSYDLRYFLNTYTDALVEHLDGEMDALVLS